MSAALPEIAERMQRAILNGRGIRLEANDLDLLVAIGVNDLVQTENAKLLREQWLTRTMKSRSIPGGQPVSGDKILARMGPPVGRLAPLPPSLHLLV